MIRIAILDLKWSYGVEEITSVVRDELSRNAEVVVISASESRLPYSVKIAKSRSYQDMLIALVNPFAYYRLFNAMKKFDPHVVYIISPHMLNVPVAMVLRLFGRRCVISHIHDPEYAGRKVVAFSANAVSYLQSKVSHRVYCWGERIRSRISENFGIPRERIIAFRHGPGQITASDKLGHAPFIRSPKMFAFIGTIHERKGIDIYLESARLFNERHGADAVEFLLAGSGDLSRYRAGIEQLPNLVVVNRFLEDAEVNEFLAKSYASVLPYTEGVMQTSFIAIAYGNGCPVIVSNIGSLPEEVEDGRTGYVVERANAEQIAAAMTRIYTDPDRAQMIQNCVAAYREKFNWNVIGDQIYRDMETSVAQLSTRECANRSPREQESQQSRLL